MKIKQYAVALTAFLHLKGPDGTLLYEDGQKVGIDLFSPGSPEYGQVEERRSARTIKRMAENDNKIAHVPLDELRIENAQDLVTLTSGFRHIEHDGPEGTPLSGQALYLAVYSDPSLGWIKEQALKFLGDWGKFTPGSATN
ncbi:MAG: hypothetical protein PGN16_08375 [Sphingomonas phyllosphaerae]|uniref:hypothetical protein n=1 Tax=Sphingomonas phyllosphaerae TaxID=257003 RepID=UPI002FFBD09A